MAKRSEFFGLAVLTVIFSYGLTVGATFNGIFNPEFHPVSLGLMALLVGGWLFMHWHGRWNWNRTSLDTVFLVWGLAFGASLLANSDAWRRIAIGLWYMGLYIGVWYVLHDLIANRALRREMIIDALLIAGLVIVLFGFLQLRVWLVQVAATGIFIAPPRPVSAFGNPNFLSAFLIVVIPLTLSRMMLLRAKPPQIILGLYVLFQVALLFLTDSRGAWIGIIVGLLVWGVLVISRSGGLTRVGMIAWWQGQTKALKTGVIASVLVGIIVISGMSLNIVRSFSDPGRGAGLRTEIYRAAVELFTEKPITGQGLFTFGRGLVRLPDVHPDKPHSHAHDAPLHIAAELGILGLAALVVTLYVGFRTMQRNWQDSADRERLLLAGSTAAVVAFGVHQLTDIPAMMPAIALTGLVALVLTLAPTKPEVVNADWARIGHPLEMVGIWSIVLVSGVWSSSFYTRYVDILVEARNTEDYRHGAEQLQAVINDDSHLSLYYLEQGFLYGMAASKGDAGAARAGIESYERFIQLDPGYAVAWANLAALHWQVDERDVAIDALQQAIRLDSVEWNYYALLGRYAEAMGNVEAATNAYKEALTLNPDASLYTELDQFVLTNPKVFDSSTMTISARVVKLMDAGAVSAAQALWENNSPVDSSAGDVIRSLLALAKSDQDGAIKWLSQADKMAISAVDQAWVYVGKARLAHFIGDGLLVDESLSAAEITLIQAPLASDDDTLLNIPYAQFLHDAIERQYLPQVDYRKDAVLLFLLDRTG